MMLTGFTDEASSDVSQQIKVTEELGWEYLSARTMGEANIHEISDAAFEKVCEQLEVHHINVAEFGTLIGSCNTLLSPQFNVVEPWTLNYN